MNIHGWLCTQVMYGMNMRQVSRTSALRSGTSTFFDPAVVSRVFSLLWDTFAYTNREEVSSGEPSKFLLLYLALVPIGPMGCSDECFAFPGVSDLSQLLWTLQTTRRTTWKNKSSHATGSLTCRCGSIIVMRGVSSGERT